MDNTTLISKKELLELTDISYGQLYRWKRKGLIPDDWFIKKSSFTGQETFFPKEKVLSRIQKIVSMKEDVSLDELADMFSPTPNLVQLHPDELLKRNIVTESALTLYLDARGSREPLSFDEALAVFILDRLIVSGNISADEGRQALEVLKDGSAALQSTQSDLLLFRKLGVFCCLMVSPPCRFFPDRGVRIIEQISLSAAAEELKLKLI